MKTTPMMMAMLGAALAGTLLAGAQASTMRSDEQITADVDALLSHDAKLHAKDPIAVSTRHGEVRLMGKVETVPMIYRAVELTRRVDGVTAVDDDDLVTYSSH